MECTNRYSKTISSFPPYAAFLIVGEISLLLLITLVKVHFVKNNVSEAIAAFEKTGNEIEKSLPEAKYFGI